MSCQRFLWFGAFTFSNIAPSVFELIQRSLGGEIVNVVYPQELEAIHSVSESMPPGMFPCVIGREPIQKQNGPSQFTDRTPIHDPPQPAHFVLRKPRPHDWVTPLENS